MIRLSASHLHGGCDVRAAPVPRPVAAAIRRSDVDAATTQITNDPRYDPRYDPLKRIDKTADTENNTN